MTDSQGERGPWTVAAEPGNCAMCGARYERGQQVRRDPAWAAWSTRCAARTSRCRASWTGSAYPGPETALSSDRGHAGQARQLQV